MPIEIMYTAVPFVLIAVLFYFTAKDENYIDALPAKPAVTVTSWGSSGAGRSATRNTA